MKKAMALFIGAMLVIGIFAGCSGETETGQSSQFDTSGATDTLLSIEDVGFLDENGDSVYRIVRPKDDSDATAVAQLVYKQMKSLLGVKIRNISDAEDGADQYEILVGNCNRPEVEVAKRYLEQKTGGRYADYIICTVGKKIVIYSQSQKSLQAAADYFAVNLLNPEGIKGGIEYIHKVEGEFEDITVNQAPIGRYTIIRQHYNASYLTELELNALIDDVFSRSGYKLQLKHDKYTEPSQYEIIVGNCDREGVEKITNSDEYRITVKGDKVYLNGGSAHATAMAVTEFKKLFKGNITDSISKSGSYDQTMAGYDKSVTLYKTFEENFDGTEINTDIWKNGDPTAWDTGLNGKQQLRSTDPNDVYVKDGSFYICAREDDENYYGGIIQTYATYKYGYIEMSSKIPHGTGFWTALYLCTDDLYSAIDPSLPQLAGPEYDVMECFGNSEHYQANIHSWPAAGGEIKGWEHISLDGPVYGNDKRYHSVDAGVPLGYDFHTYGMMWDDERVTFTCDADPFFSYDTTLNEQDIETNNHSVWIRIAMNVGSATNPEPGITDSIEDWQNTNKFQVDWINVYQKNDGKCMWNGKILH